MISWKPIEDLDESSTSLSHRGVQALAKLWVRLKDTQGDSASLKVFLERLRREWAIETGILERAYELDPGTTQLLIEQGFLASLIPHESEDKPPEWVARVLEDNRQALDVLFDVVAERRDLTTGFIKELHALLMRDHEYVDAIDSLGQKIQVPLLKGDWKKQPNNPRRADGNVHEYCPPEHVPSEMDRLLEVCRSQEQKSVALEVRAAWLHHRFTQIHPFQDGNGRVARALASLVFIKGNWLPLLVRRGDRSNYLKALEVADHGDILPLVNLFAHLQERAIVEAMAAALPPAETLVEAAAERLRDDAGVSARDRVTANNRIAAAFSLSLVRIAKFRDHANSVLSGHFDLHLQDGGEAVWTSDIESALPRHLRPISGIQQRWIRLSAPAPHQMELLVAIHGAGPLFRGVLGEVAMLRFKAAPAPFAITGNPFIFSIEESAQDMANRLGEWLEVTLSQSIGSWLHTL